VWRKSTCHSVRSLRAKECTGACLLTQVEGSKNGDCDERIMVSINSASRAERCPVLPPLSRLRADAEAEAEPQFACHGQTAPPSAGRRHRRLLA
jgi:hypothetical protein